MRSCVQPAFAIVLLIFIIFIGVASATPQPEVITVCPTGCNFTSIQDAINYASPGDTIDVMSGSYSQVVDVNKSVNLIGIPDSGVYPHVGQYTKPVAVTVSAPDVIVDGFDLYGAGEHAIELKASHVTIRNVTVGIHRPGYESDAVIDGTGVSDITIADCMMQSTGVDGIYFQDSQNLTVERNVIIVNNESTYGRPEAIAVIFSPSDVEYSEFRFENNTVTGGGIESSVTWPDDYSETPYIRDVLIKNNTVSGCSSTDIVVDSVPEESDTGESVYHVSGVEIQGNNVSDSEEGSGIYVVEARDGVISGNMVKNLKEYESGIDLDASTRFRVLDNTISDCTGDEMTGLSLYGVTSSRVSGNRMDRNTYNFQYDGGQNLSPMMDIDGTNLADGRPIRYYESMSHFSVDGDEANGAGYYFINCQDFTASRLAPSDMYNGIFLLNCQNGTLTHSSVERCDVGISLLSSSDSIVYTNRLVENRNGIRISGFNNSLVWRNDVINSTDYGVIASGLNHDLKINNNNVQDSFIGIMVSLNPLVAYNCSIILDGNEIRGNTRGLAVRGTKGVIVTNNVIGDSTGMGILLQYARDARFSQNQIRNNSIGMEIINSPFGSIATGNNTIVDNYFNNFNQVNIIGPEDPKGELFIDQKKDPLSTDEIEVPVSVIEVDPSSEANDWNTTKTAGMNIVGGPYLGGNYWASPDGTGFSETHPDRGDGFCNESYFLDEHNIDYLPLHAYTPKPTFYADFTVSPVNGTVPLTVKCNDKSVGNPTRFTYDFGDGVNVTGPNPVHTYKLPGTYTITLTVTKYNATMNSIMSSVAVKPNAITVTGVTKVPLVSKFIASPVNGTAPLKVTFTDQSTGNLVLFSYDFGDGINVTGKNPVHTYQFPGVYNVTQIIVGTDSTGRSISNSSVKNSLITVYG